MQYNTIYVVHINSYYFRIHLYEMYQYTLNLHYLMFWRLGSSATSCKYNKTLTYYHLANVYQAKLCFCHLMKVSNIDSIFSSTLASTKR